MVAPCTPQRASLGLPCYHWEMHHTVPRKYLGGKVRWVEPTVQLKKESHFIISVISYSNQNRRHCFLLCLLCCGAGKECHFWYQMVILKSLLGTFRTSFSIVIPLKQRTISRFFSVNHFQPNSILHRIRQTSWRGVSSGTIQGKENYFPLP